MATAVISGLKLRPFSSSQRACREFGILSSISKKDFADTVCFHSLQKHAKYVPHWLAGGQKKRPRFSLSSCVHWELPPPSLTDHTHRRARSYTNTTSMLPPSGHSRTLHIPLNHDSKKNTNCLLENEWIHCSPAMGMFCVMESCTSPVPGGMSTTK